MICKDNQEMIDNLLRLKVDGDNDNNKIAFLMSKPNRNRKDNETLCDSLINEIMDAHKTQNKIASVESTSKTGELVEFEIFEVLDNNTMRPRRVKLQICH
jgi:hypothetical protein